MSLSRIDKQLHPVLKATLWVGGLLFLFEIAARLSQEIIKFFSSLDFPLEIKGLFTAIVTLIVVNVPLMIAEQIAPGTTNKRNYLQGALYWLIYTIAAYFWSLLAVAIITKLQIAPLFTWNVADTPNSIFRGLIIIAGVFLPVFIFDFFYYWFHRAQHRFGLLWRFHKVHHSIVQMNSLNSYHHISEEVLRFPIITLPITFLIRIDAPQIMFLSAFIATWGNYIHSDTAIHLGKLGYVFADNAYHRIHHSVLEQHFDKNFAAFFPVWDRLFGTYHRPIRGRLTAVGLWDTLPPKSVIDYILMPFRRNS